MENNSQELCSTPEPEVPSSEKRHLPFRKSAGTYIVLIFLIFAFPGFNLIVAYIGGNEIDFSQFDPILFFFLPTIIMLWSFVLVILLALWREKSSLSSIGMGFPTLAHLGLGIGFLLISNISLVIIQGILKLFGIPFNNNTDQILAIASDHIGWWLVISITAGVCEEIVYRGYLMTRIKGIIGRGWVIPIIGSVFAFSSGHLYQGTGGVIVITLYGAMFCGLYILTGSIWPGIIAHFIQDFSAVYVYRLAKMFGAI
ncbi:MAG: CPBP family intramembrane metalloprotease [candidate division Zixibacteria bacterium]|nr:CPBP family intramembrane metalloprotease [candidate division Zixibacteria bacterium]